jgi:hypothetical protein
MARSKVSIDSRNVSKGKQSTAYLGSELSEQNQDIFRHKNLGFESNSPSNANFNPTQVMIN